jgi:serine/threonine protein kinase
MYFTDSADNVWFCKFKWAIVSSFTEIKEGCPVHGFTVKLNERAEQDFYVKSEEDLETWIGVLATFATLTQIEEDFVVIKEIDSGRFGAVKLCQDLKSHQQFALKQIEKTTLVNPKYVNQLFNEISLLRKLDHKNIIKLYRVYEDPECVYLVLEYVPCGNLLQKVLKEKRFKYEDIREFATKLFEVLNYIHSQGVIHRDLKLENILMTSQKFLTDFKLADFGLACYSDKSLKLKSGSPGYMAPEILRGESYSTKVDIFSAGVIIYILFTSSSPFLAVSQDKVIQKNLKCDIDFDCKALKSLGKETLGLMKSILCSDPTFRPTALQVLKILKNDGSDQEFEKSGKIGRNMTEETFEMRSSRFLIFK